MKNATVVVILAVVLSLAGARISAYLVNLHLSDAAVPAWFKAVCSTENDSTYDCSAAARSRWAYFPPLAEEGKPGPRNIPVALLGLWYFSFMTVWYLFVGRVSGGGRVWHWLPTVLNTLGMGAAVYFVVVMFTKMDTRCLWCLITHAINLLLLGCTLFLWRANYPLADETAAPPAISGPPHPSRRLALATISLAVVLVFAQFVYVRAGVLGLEVKEHRKFYESVKGDVAFLLNSYQNQKKQEIPIRPDDPILGSGSDMLELVVFSDFLCPRCRDFAKELDEKLIPLFKGKLKVVFKHYPACVDCNPSVPTTLKGHELACVAAQAAEAARLQGGAEAFWKAHDKLFAVRDQLAKTDWASLAAGLGLDPAKFDADRSSDTVKQRIREDVELAQKLEVKGTPAVFLSRRFVPPLARESDVFWREMKKSYDAMARQKAAGKNAQPAVEKDE